MTRLSNVLSGSNELLGGKSAVQYMVLYLQGRLYVFQSRRRLDMSCTTIDEAPFIKRNGKVLMWISSTRTLDFFWRRPVLPWPALRQFWSVMRTGIKTPVHTKRRSRVCSGLCSSELLALPSHLFPTMIWRRVTHSRLASLVLYPNNH